MGGKRLYRKYDKKTGELIELECGKCHEIKTVDCFNKDKSKKMVLILNANDAKMKEVVNGMKTILIMTVKGIKTIKIK